MNEQAQLALAVKYQLLSRFQDRINKDKVNDFENVKDETKDDFIQEFADFIHNEATKLEMVVDGYTNDEMGTDEVNDTCADYANEALDLIQSL